MHRSVRRGVLIGGLLAMLLASVVAPGTALAGRRAAPTLAAKAPPVVRQMPCADSIFTCVTIRVPRECLGTPDRVRVSVRANYSIPGPNVVDWGPGRKKFFDWVWWG